MNVDTPTVTHGAPLFTLNDNPCQKWRAFPLKSLKYQLISFLFSGWGGGNEHVVTRAGFNL